jgi:hypothetical protein
VWAAAQNRIQAAALHIQTGKDGVGLRPTDVKRCSGKLQNEPERVNLKRQQTTLSHD